MASSRQLLALLAAGELGLASPAASEEEAWAVFLAAEGANAEAHSYDAVTCAPAKALVR